jgi:predicted ATPase
MSRKSTPRIEYLKVQNYRSLHNLELKNITPLTVFLGPNGSGKSTIFDVFAFLSECFTESLRKAWDRRGRFRELRTRGSEGCIVIELKYRENYQSPLITYHIAINEANNRPLIAEEWLHWPRGQFGKPFRFLDFKKGEGEVVSGEMPDELTEECRRTSTNTQLMVTTHSPFFVDGLKPEELWVLYRDEKGFTQAKRTADMQGIKEFIQQGANLGSLWMEDYFEVGNPLKS